MHTVRNYQKELERILAELEQAQGRPPRLFLHSCCAPCSSYVLEYLRRYFDITVFYYNPNISMEPEYRKRLQEQKRLIAAYNEALDKDAALTGCYPIEIAEGEYEPDCFDRIAAGLEQCPEGGERCFACYRLRIAETVRQAAAGEFDYAATTLTISPLKNAHKINEIGEELVQEQRVRWLPSDFKKRDGYKRSIILSREYRLYRQDYCGCVYSKAERDNKKGLNQT